MAEMDLERRWGEVSRAVGEELAVWRREHPRASLSAIEAALEERWAKARAHLVQEAAEASAARDLKQGAPGPAASCPACGGIVREKSWEARQLTTDDDGRGPDGPLGTIAGRVLRLRPGAFPPWMRSWSSCRGV